MRCCSSNLPYPVSHFKFPAKGARPPSSAMLSQRGNQSKSRERGSQNMGGRIEGGEPIENPLLPHLSQIRMLLSIQCYSLANAHARCLVLFSLQAGLERRMAIGAASYLNMPHPSCTAHTCASLAPFRSGSAV